MKRAARAGRPWGAAAVALALGGCDLRLGQPHALWLLWLVPALAILLGWSRARRARLAARIAAPGLLRSLTLGESRLRAWSKAGLLLLACAALALALAEPKYGFEWEEAHRRGVDLVVALDVSQSMSATDDPSGGQASRLQRAQRKIIDLLGRLDGGRVGLVAFAGTAFVECPLTLDYGAMRTFVEAMDPEVISAKGTSVAEAIRAAMKAFEGGDSQSRAILLVSDGEETADAEARAAAEEAAKAGVRIYALGIGSLDGAPIPRGDGSFHRDRGGELVLSKLEEATLREVALASGGAYARSVPGDEDLQALYQRGIKATLRERELEAQRTQRWHERYQWLVGLALLALALELFVPECARRKDA